ncbi:alpha/beta hydrolase [Tateyamaria sp. Alg231-49]|uniref:alpha/beta hydrolase n=1 Tax=Tateyamaria sp. Alg231-49 TaxID=1922219 RepID=UPI000D558510|nr:alpha/beta hydrolase [Tateyamaria sp. Alg231-49]
MKTAVLCALSFLGIFLVVEAEDVSAEELTPVAGGGFDVDPVRLASLAPPPRLSDRELDLHTVPCLPGTTLGIGEIEGQDYFCGVFTVPQNWWAPDGLNLDIGFLVARASGETPRRDPLLSLAGGPGQSSVLAPIVEKYRSVRFERDIIFFDIRGAGVSQRLGVEECLVLALQNGAPTDQIAALQSAATRFLAVARNEETPSTPRLWDLDIPVLNETCWEQFTAQGIDLNQFTTASNARDAIELISAIGYDEFNIEGVSYGTRLAMAIMDGLPGYADAPQLRSVVLDSTFPPSVYLIRTIVHSDHDFILQLLEECSTDRACDAAYPSLGHRLADLLISLDDQPLSVDSETVNLADVVAQLTNVSGSRAAYIPRMIVELEAGELDTYLALRDGQVGTELAESSMGFTFDMADPVQAFISNAATLLDDQAAAEFVFYMSFGLVQDDPIATLRTIVDDGYAGDIRAQMSDMLERLTVDDVVRSPYVARQRALISASEENSEAQRMNLRRSITGTLPHFLYTAIHCADDILHERFEDAVNSYNDLLFPQLTDLDMSRAEAGRCVGWPVQRASIEAKNPVESEVPTLILQGAYDKPTPTYMGRRAHRELNNSTYVLVPQQGHGTWNSAESCVGQIAAAFLDAPSAGVDLDCLDARRPQWALP